jgi:hypothetical protein
MAVFPYERMRRAAEPDEVVRLAAEFARSDMRAQTSLEASWAAMDDATLAEHLAALRSSGHFEPEESELVSDEPEVKDEPESLPTADADEGDEDADDDEGD